MCLTGLKNCSGQMTTVSLLFPPFKWMGLQQLSYAIPPLFFDIWASDNVSQFTAIHTEQNRSQGAALTWEGEKGREKEKVSKGIRNYPRLFLQLFF